MNERLTWEEIQEKYPDRWVAMKDCVMNGVDIVTAIVECVCSDEEQDEKMCEYLERGVGLTWDRTTKRGGYRVQCLSK